MRRPWYSYLLLSLGILMLLGAVFRPLSSVGGAGPGAVIHGPEGRVTHVWAGSPLDRAGVRLNDRFVSGENIERGDFGGELVWKENQPRSGQVTVLRDGRRLTMVARPQPPVFWVGVAWLVLKLLNVGLVGLALALFWQRPRDGRAVLLGLVLLSAPVFALPPVFRLWALTLATHFFSVFPAARPGRRWPRVLGIYGSFVLAVLVGGGMAKDGHTDSATVLYHLTAIGFGGYSLLRVLGRWKGAAEAERPVIRTLTAAAGAILTAVLCGLLQPPWQLTSVSPLTTLLPAALFSAAVAHLVFRLRALEIQVIARRTFQYLLARWTLGTLFLIPGFFLVFSLGQASGSKSSPKPGDWLVVLLWMGLVAILSRKRNDVLRNLDRRFFRDIEAARQRLIRLAQELGSQPTADAVFHTFETGVREALNPAFIRFAPESEPLESGTSLCVPIRRGQALHGYAQLGAKPSGTEYTAEERDLLEAAGIQAAMALENARLSAALLEQQRAELAVRTAGVLAGAEEERRRLAADLHDQVLPELRQIAGEFERLKAHANGLEPDLARLEGEVRGTMDSVREVMEALRPSALDVLGLPDALESYFRKGAARCRPPLTVTVRRTGEEPMLTPEQSLGLYRICQEAINNVLKHSGAGRAGLEIRSDPARLTLVVWDDGTGVNLETANGQGHGLANIGYRADLIGATVQWLPGEDGGTRVEVSLDLAAAPAPRQS